jgi:DNA-binding transcriptional MocR family regulator
MDEDGALPDALEEKLRDLAAQGQRTKLLYLIPNFHNPTGACMPVDRRRRILDLCEQHNILIVEDDAYGELRFDETQPPSLYSMARGRGVIKAGSFSKIIAPGMRVGWCLASPPIITALLATRFDMGQSPVINRMIYEYAKDGALDDHIVAQRAVYRQKRDVMMNELAERCSHLATWSEPHGGFFAWLRLHESIDPQRLQQTVREEGVIPVFGPSFFVPNTPGAEPDRYVRLAYSYTAEDQIAEGIRRLARAIERARR